MLNIDSADPLSSLEEILPGKLVSIFQRIDTLREQLIAQHGALWRCSATPERAELEKLDKCVRQLARALTPEQHNAVLRAGTWLVQKGRTGASAMERFVLRSWRRACLICPDLNSPRIPLLGR